MLYCLSTYIQILTLGEYQYPFRVSVRVSPNPVTDLSDVTDLFEIRDKFILLLNLISLYFDCS